MSELAVKPSKSLEDTSMADTKLNKKSNTQLNKLHAHDFSLFLELRTKKLKRSLEGWREIVLNAHSILLWEKQWHPGVIYGVINVVFFILWAFDPSVLTTVSTIALLATVGDYLIPTIAAGVFRNDMWTGVKEKKFDEICRNLVIIYTKLSSCFSAFYLMRSTRPKMYYSVSVGALILLAWLGSSVNNLLLTYFMVSMCIMLPGLEHQGYISKYTGSLSNKIKDFVKNTKVKNDTKAD